MKIDTKYRIQKKNLQKIKFLKRNKKSIYYRFVCNGLLNYKIQNRGNLKNETGWSILKL